MTLCFQPPVLLKDSYMRQSPSKFVNPDKNHFDMPYILELKMKLVGRNKRILRQKMIFNYITLTIPKLLSFAFVVLQVRSCVVQWRGMKQVSKGLYG